MTFETPPMNAIALEVLRRIVAGLVEDRLVEHQRALRGERNRIAVGGCARELRHRNRAAGAGLVLDDHRLTEGLRQFLSHVTRNDVRGAARRERHQELDRLRRIRLRPGERRHREGERAHDKFAGPHG
jgi:hypothetical protein